MALKTVVASGNWSNPNIWSPSPPTDGDDVQHGSQYTVYLDTDTPNLGSYTLAGNLLVVPPSAGATRQFKATSGSFTGTIDIYLTGNEMGEVLIKGLGASRLNFSALTNFLASYSETFQTTQHRRWWGTQRYPTVTNVGTAGGVVVVTVSAESGSAAQAYLDGKNGQTVPALVLMKFTDYEGQQRRYLFVPTSAAISGNNVTLNDIADTYAGRVILGAPLVFPLQTKLAPVILENIDFSGKSVSGCAIKSSLGGEAKSSIVYQSDVKLLEECIMHPSGNFAPAQAVNRLWLAPISATNPTTIATLEGAITADEVHSLSSDLPTKFCANSLSLPQNYYLCLFRERSHWSVSGKLSGADFLWEKPNEAYAHIGSTDSSGAISVTDGYIVRRNFNLSGEFLKLYIASDSYELKVGGQVTFLGETFDKCELKIISADSNGGVSIPLPFKKRNAGFGVVSLPSGGYIGFLNKGGVFTSEVDTWVAVSRDDIQYILRAQGSNNDTFILANLTEWDDGELPCYALATSDGQSPLIYKFVLAKVNNIGRVSYEFTRPPFTFLTIRYRTGSPAYIQIVDGTVERYTVSSENWSYLSFKPYSDRIVFKFSTAGVAEIDIYNLNRNYYPNYERVAGLCGSVQSVVSVLPSTSDLPKEGYTVLLHPSPRQVQMHLSKLNYIAKMLAREGIILRFGLDYGLALNKYLRALLVDVLSAIPPVSVVIYDGKVYLWLVCATQEVEAQVLGNAVRAVKSVLSLLSNIVPSLANYEVIARPIHRIAP